MEESSTGKNLNTTAAAVGTAGTDAANKDLLDKVRTQMEFYFSVENLQNDSFLVAQMDSNRSVAISEVMKFNKLKALTTDENVVTKSLEGSQICIVENGRVRGSMKATNRSTLILRDIPSDAPAEEVKEIFDFSGQDTRPITSIRSDIGDTWFVHFETEEGAKETLAELKARKITFRGNAVKGRVKSETIARSFYPVPSPTAAGVSPMGMPMYPGMPSPYAYPGGLPPMQMAYGFAGEGMDPSRVGQGGASKGVATAATAAAASPTAGGGDMKPASPNNKKNNAGTGGAAQSKGNKGGKDSSTQKMNGGNLNNNNNNTKGENAGGRQKEGNNRKEKRDKNYNEIAFNNNLADFPALDGAVSTSAQTNIRQIVDIAKPYMSETDQANAYVATAAERLQSVALSGDGNGGSGGGGGGGGGNDSISSSLSNSVWGKKTAVAAVQTPPVVKPPTEAIVKPLVVVTNSMEMGSAGPANTTTAATNSPTVAAASPSTTAGAETGVGNGVVAATSVTTSPSTPEANVAAPVKPGSWAALVSSGPMPDPSVVTKLIPKKTSTGAGTSTSPGRPSLDEKKKDGKKDSGGDKGGGDKNKKKASGDNSSSASSTRRNEDEHEKEVIESPSSWGGRPTFANVRTHDRLCF